MGQTIRSRRLGADLRALRKKCELTAEAVGLELGFSQSKMSRIESGEVRVSRTDMKALLALYGVTTAEEIEEFVRASKEARSQGWWIAYDDALPRDYKDVIALEATANNIRNFQTLVIPGLAQTPDYAKHIITASPAVVEPSQVDALVQVRIDRQQTVLDSPTPPRIWLIVTEAAIRQVVGAGKIMIAQLMHLIKLTERPNLTLQVLPFNAGAHAGLAGSFVVYDFPGKEASVAYTEQLTGALFMGKPGQVDAYCAAFDNLRADALNPAESLELIRHVKAEM